MYKKKSKERKTFFYLDFQEFQKFKLENLLHVNNLINS